MTPRTLSLFALAALGLPTLATAQHEDTTQDRLDQVVAENAVLKRELRAIKEIVDGTARRLLAAESRPTAGMKIGIVDIGVLFRDSPQKAQFEARINELRQNYKIEINLMRAKADKIRRDQPDLAELALREYEVVSARSEADLKRRVKANTLQILAEVNSNIRAYGKQNGFDLILKVDAVTNESDSQDYDELIFRAQISDVTYWNDALDVTQEVNALANAGDSPVTAEEALALVNDVVTSAGGTVEAFAQEGSALRADLRFQEVDLGQAAGVQNRLRTHPRLSTRYTRLECEGVTRIEDPNSESGEAMVFTVKLYP